MNLRPIKIRSVKKYTKPTSVYDITVRDNSNFFAGKILVHNCPFQCKYCYADSFRASLYTAFFDNSKSVGLRHCNPTFYKKELDKMMKFRGSDPHALQGPRKALAMEIPMRLGIRFEDFTFAEARKGISLEILKYLSDNAYPIMINTKSNVVGRDAYVRALADNPARSAVHITMISSREEFLKRLEPGAPPFARRVAAAKALCDAGVRVVARIEPYLLFETDGPDDVEEYSQRVWDAGVRHITFDTYSYSARNPGIRANFHKIGLDFDRLFLLGCDSQGLGSILLDSYMDLFRAKGFSCSSFDLGCVPHNQQSICCEVGDWFQGGFNWGCVVGAIRFITDRGLLPTTWKNFESWVMSKGGFLTPALRIAVHELWNAQGNDAYSIAWGQGIEPIGWNEDGVIWRYRADYDFRKDLI
jgi:DNA repair photolyase